MINGKIMVVDDEPDIRNLVKEILEDEGFNVDTAENADQARNMKETFNPDLILLDIWMPGTDGISLLKEWKESKLMETPIIMMSGHGTVETAVEATKVGAYDFIEKPLSLAKLTLTVKHALENITLQHENVRLRNKTQYVELPVGNSRIMQQLYEQIARIANHDAPVLIIGETGSEKEIFARYLHKQSNRSKGPFVSVSISALSADNAIAVIYGSEDRGIIRKGLLESANNGILFLKDIADMELALQARLQHTIENQIITRLNGNDVLPINVRFITATSHDLEEQVRANKFRDDLYYQLNILPLNIPPLREHFEDIPDLLSFFINYFVEQQSLPFRQFNSSAQNYLRNYDWPGNIRELKNLVQRLLILGTRKNIDIEEIEVAMGRQSSQIYDKEFNANFELPLRQAREQFEKSYLQYKLERANGSVSKVANEVGMERTHLYRKLKNLGIDIKPE
jgi:two-component system, NtrC family, nitrogen regulation response regulator NtrX